MNPELKEFLLRILGIKESEFNMSMKMENVSQWDSLKHMELVTQFEDEFDVQLTMEEIATMTTFSQISEVFEAKN